jgi:hypothetical protein
MCFSTNLNRFLPVGIGILAFCAGALLRFPQMAPAIAAPPTVNPPGTWLEIKTEPYGYERDGTRGTMTTWVDLQKIDSIEFTQFSGRESVHVRTSGGPYSKSSDDPKIVAYFRAYVKNRRAR